MFTSYAGRLCVFSACDVYYCLILETFRFRADVYIILALVSLHSDLHRKPAMRFAEVGSYGSKSSFINRLPYICILSHEFICSSRIEP